MADELALRIADVADVGMLRVDDEQVIGQANATAHRHLRRAEGKLVGRTVLEAFVDHRVADLIDQLGKRREAQVELSLGGEPQRTLLVHALRGGTGEIWLVLRDLSELRRLQRIRTEFIDNLSHELRTPLTNLRLLVETLALELDSGVEVPARIRESVARMDVETAHLATMVTELLDLARIEQGEVALRRDPVDLGRVVESVIDRLQPFAERHHVTLRSELPVAPEDRLVAGDAERLEQLLVNLTHNALKFSMGGAAVVVSARPDPADAKSLVLQVADNGPGIPRHALERIFERFYKVDRARTREGSGGTGLGLAIARHIAEAHGGRIWAESIEGEGATFFVALPRG